MLTYYRTSTGGLSASLERMERGWLRLVEVVNMRKKALCSVDLVLGDC